MKDNTTELLTMDEFNQIYLNTSSNVSNENNNEMMFNNQQNYNNICPFDTTNSNFLKEDNQKITNFSIKLIINDKNNSMGTTNFSIENNNNNIIGNSNLSIQNNNNNMKSNSNLTIQNNNNINDSNNSIKQKKMIFIIKKLHYKTQ